MKVIGRIAVLAILVTETSAFSSQIRAPFLSRQQTKSLQPLSLFQLSCRDDERNPNYNRHSSSDWLHNIRSLPQSGVLREVRKPVLAVFAWSVVVSVVQRVLSNCSYLTGMAQSMCIPGTAHSFLVSALGLLLVFRTNSAYQRFYEGRKIWENILSISRNLSRMIQLYSKEVGSDRKQRIMNMVAAYPYLLRHHIRPGCLCENDKESIQKGYRLKLHEPAVRTVETRHEGDTSSLFGSTSTESLPETTSTSSAAVKPRPCWVDRRKLPWSLFENKRALKNVARAHNRPLWACDRMGREIVSIPYGPNFTSRERLTLLRHVEKLTDAVGQCERIHKTAVPLNYARHSLRSLTLWLFTLPFALVKDLGLLTAPATACIAWLLFGVYQIGYSIEDPFQGSLRLSVLCDAIRRDVTGVMGDSNDTRDSAYTSELWEDEDTTSSTSTAADDTLTSTTLSHHATSLLPDKKLLNAPTLVKQKNGTWSIVEMAER